MASPWADLIESDVPGVVLDSGEKPAKPWADLVEPEETKEKLAKKQKNLPPLVRIPMLEKLLGKPEDSPSAPTVARQLAKGVPVAGGFVPQNEEMDEMAQNWPGATKTANISGNILGTAGPVGALTKGTQFMRLPGQVAAHAGMGAGMNMADVAARKGFDAEGKDFAMEGGKGAVFGGLGPIFNKILSPGRTDAQILHKGLSRQEKDELFDMALALRKSGMPRKQADAQAKKDWADAVRDSNKQDTEGAIRRLLRKTRETDSLGSIAGRGALASLPFILGQAHPVVSGGIGALSMAAPYLPKVGAAYKNNSFFQNPDTATIMNILMSGGNAGAKQY